jgi:hypothetical protein
MEPPFAGAWGAGGGDGFLIGASAVASPLATTAWSSPPPHPDASIAATRIVLVTGLCDAALTRKLSFMAIGECEREGATGQRRKNPRKIGFIHPTCESLHDRINMTYQAVRCVSGQVGHGDQDSSLTPSSIDKANAKSQQISRPLGLADSVT